MRMRPAMLGSLVLVGLLIYAVHPKPQTITPQTKSKSKPKTESAKQLKQDIYWLKAQQEVYKKTNELQQQQKQEESLGIRYAKLMHGNPSTPTVALTFDDGPHPTYTPKILEILKKYHIRTTFFVVGRMAEMNPKLVKAELAAHHTLGNHTYHHVNLTKINPLQIETEWQACQDVVKSITGTTMQYCRPPGGDYNSKVITAAEEIGLVTVLWTDDPGDYSSPGSQIIVNRTLRKVSNGGIILIHDGIQQTIDVLPKIIEALQKRGFKFVTIDEMEKSVKGRA